MVLTISRDILTDKQNKVHLSLNQSTWSDCSDEKKNFNHIRRNGREFSFLTSCQFPDLSIVFCESLSHLALAFYHILMEIYSKCSLVRSIMIDREFSIFGNLH